VKVLREWLIPAHEVPTFEQSTVVRARVDTAEWIGDRPVLCGLATTAATAAAIALGAVLAAPFSLAGQCGVAAGAGCIGFAATLIVVFVTQFVLAAPRQRDEARAELQRLAQPEDLVVFSQEFSAAAMAMQASLPKYGMRLIPSIFDENTQARAEHEKREDGLARLHAGARADYHRRFRQTVVSVLGSDAESPAGIGEIVELAERLADTVREPGRAQRIIDAAGQPVGDRQRGLLEALCDSVQLCVANDRLVDYGDVTADAPDNEAAFRAHFKDLLPALADWQRAVRARDEAVGVLEAWIPAEISQRGLADLPFAVGSVAECFTEISVGRALRRERNDPREIHLRCVQDAPHEPTLWSAYLHSGRREFKVAELSQPVVEFSVAGMAEFHRQVAKLDDTLQACFDAIQGSRAALRVTEAQDAVFALQPPLRSQLRRWKVTSHLEFAAGCPYCLDELGVAAQTPPKTTSTYFSG
jgi:hypothetical protein